MTIRPFIIGVMTEWVEALVKRKKFCCKNVILSEQTRSSFKLTLKHQASLMEELLKKRYHKQTTKQPSSKNAGTIDTRA